ncbi:6166_t:CDS:2 [Funneliformis geosporum]|uniref:16628_t:CDS:1 n=1 Tax=Funneliformis geosporum TaxID=1117311 RepID=A0A9W4SCW0_9GLOM|nr:16628_t:CDS:2 [Funneliformis geosporum]CAI2169189.1 6166_t:CDS:2 [Funneliformis geosporum]
MGNNFSRFFRRNNNEGYYYEGRLLFNDEEIDRIQVQHHYFRESWNGNFSSPVKDVLIAGGAKVLDIGCGPGIFLCDMASDYPRAYFVGIDLLSKFPSLKPYNVSFVQCNILEGLPFENDTFDFVYCRFLLFDIKEFQWQDLVLREMSRVVKSNGWIELMEPRPTVMNQGPSTERICNAIQAKARGHRMNPNIVDEFERWLGLINNLQHIKREIKRLPCGKWAGKHGELGALFMHNVFKKHLQFVDNLINVPSNAHDVALNDFLQEFDLYRSYIEVYRFFAQKIDD